MGSNNKSFANYFQHRLIKFYFERKTQRIMQKDLWKGIIQTKGKNTIHIRITIGLICKLAYKLTLSDSL